MANKFYPIKMKPEFKDYIWGGRKLIDKWKMPCHLEKAAEAWVLSAHKNGESIGKNGEFSGMPLSLIVETLGKKCLGLNNKNLEKFPVLIKFIDADDNLSIQVHPDDKYALLNENSYGKTEFWYVVEAEENASLLYGFSRDITRNEYINHIKNGTLLDVMKEIPVKSGDSFFISPGTVHAIGKGIIIAEIQQNSDITYRVFDYNRKGPTGETRPLHIDKAVDVSSLKKSFHNENTDNTVIPGKRSKKSRLAECEYFTVFKYDITHWADLFAGDSTFDALLFLKGEGNILFNGEKYPCKKGDCFFVPSGTGVYTVAGEMCFLLVRT